MEALIPYEDDLILYEVRLDGLGGSASDSRRLEEERFEEQRVKLQPGQSLTLVGIPGPWSRLGDPEAPALPEDWDEGFVILKEVTG